MNWFRLHWRRRGGKQRSCEPPATLALLLPDDLTEGEFADGIQRALVHSRDALADQARHNAELAEQEQQDEVRRAYLIGGSEAFSEAAARIDAAVAGVFEVSAQRPDRR
ncbi:hypothetical protein [Actinomadura sp. 7K507]|uniref:hypothetical protein n=1 Tax=Actinomadura sp. 7K507 TaxID=2530365 RepID=UPI00104CDDCC|nr:hypothetical protein [Actinomadura sp. 7K507]TDC91988.1 hypothetical protein E1285_12480 [Actinomadura sp. 7K507]